MITLTTLSDINFLPQGLSLYQSLEKHTKDFKLYYLCLDNEIYEFFRDEIQNGQYKNIIPVDIRVLHVDQDYLQLLKKPLSFEAMNVGNKKNIDPKRMEMMWCLASFFSYYVLETYNPDSVIYVDSDVYFYSDVQNIVDKIENKSIGIVKNNASDENNGKYKVYHKVLNAKDYEVPQKRERILIVGVHSSISKTFTYPEKNKKMVVLKDVLSDVPPSIGASYPEHKANVMKLVPQGGCWVDLPKDIQKSYMGEKSLAAGGGKRGIARRLAMNEQCLTLTTSPCQKQTERCHPIENRPLNVREYARIQTFPDSYVFEGSMGNQYKQIGNAVPIKLALAMGKHIKQFLEQS